MEAHQSRLQSCDALQKGWACNAEKHIVVRLLTDRSAREISGHNRLTPNTVAESKKPHKALKVQLIQELTEIAVVV